MIHIIEFRAMGCAVSVQLEADAYGAEILKKLPERVAKIEAVLTRFQPESELMRLNARAGEWTQVSNLLLANICTAKQAARLTDGLYNPLILPALIANGYDRSFEYIVEPTTSVTSSASDWRDIELKENTREVCIPAGSALDLGGIAKGWTATLIADELSRHGTSLVNFGGDLVARGAPDGLSGWMVEIEDPFSGEPFETVFLRDQSIVTSGVNYRRWRNSEGQDHHHIIDPRTGLSATSDVLSATVIHPRATTAEAYAKAVILHGSEQGLNWLNEQWHVAGLVFRHDGAVMATSNLTTFTEERISLS